MAFYVTMIIVSLLSFGAGYVFALSKAFGRSIRWAILYGFAGSMRSPSMDEFVGLENRFQREDFALQVLIALKDLSPGPYVFFPSTIDSLRGILRLAEQRMKLKAEEGFRKSPTRVQ